MPSSYFSENYKSLAFPIDDGTRGGFRPAQLAAIHSISSHLYSQPKTPAIVVMPTGSGKTLVINTITFTERAKRVLVITPSRVVREQIAEGFSTLDDLKRISALPALMPEARVLSTKNKVLLPADWEAMRDFDVVVATVPSISPAIANVPAPPADLFDLVVVDEAHHSPARTWQSVLMHFPGAKQVLFTATPFRNDDREIKGRIVFLYDIRRAHEDGVFGDITFRPVTTVGGGSSDAEIAKATERQFKNDRSEGLDHLVMVRTDSREKAEKLVDVYAQNTRLRLQLVSGSHSLKHVRGVIKGLQEGKLDGVVCVNMMGEGFNLPRLKIAAVHAPFRSLAVTLQFIGRFARTTAGNIGTASFIGVPSEIQIETEKLWNEHLAWREIVHNLSASRIAAEMEARKFIESFEQVADPNISDLSLYTLTPYHHVKVYSTPQGVDLKRKVDFPQQMSLAYSNFSYEHQVAVYVTREEFQPRWSHDRRLTHISYELFIVFSHENSGLLFISSTRREQGLYELIGDSVSLGQKKILSHHRINQVLNDIEGLELFNVGLRNRTTLGNTESYRTLAGPDAGRAINKSDGLAFDRGHCFGKGTEDDASITIGLSTSSKIWSNQSGSLFDLVSWCDHLAKKLSSGRLKKTNSGLDHLSVGVELEALPTGILVVSWPKDAFHNAPIVVCKDQAGSTQTLEMLDLDINLRGSDTDGIDLDIVGSTFLYQMRYSLNAGSLFQSRGVNQVGLFVQSGQREIPILEYLDDHPLIFYDKDLSRIEGVSLFRVPEGLLPYDLDGFEVVDWGAVNVDIKSEKPPAPNGKLSIFDWLENRLRSLSMPVVFNDDGAGEIADFISIDDSQDQIVVTFYHCKKSSGKVAGKRVSDAYEVCGQAVKSITWTQPKKLLDQIRGRARRTNSSFIVGNQSTIERILGDGREKTVQFQITVVQPGFQKSNFSESIGSIAAATSDYLRGANALALKIIGSA